MAQRKSYEVIVTTSASNRYDAEVLTYLNDNFSLERALEIDQNIINKIRTLETLPNRGRKEPSIDDPTRTFRFILHKESRNVEVKIIYYVNEEIRRVIVTDIFPTQKDSIEIYIRS